jgi:ATP-dependent RNA helicase DHX29
MAKKKKSSLAPVNRGFATTSQPKKPVPVVEEPEEPVPEVKEDVPLAQGVAVAKDHKISSGQTNKEDGADDWESEYKVEEGIYQGYVERLQEKGEKEINRIIKVSFDLKIISKTILKTFVNL